MRSTDFRVSSTDLLKDVRIARRFSQREIANAAGGLIESRIPEQTYNKIETGERTCSLMQGQAIAKILGRPTTDLFELKDV